MKTLSILVMSLPLLSAAVGAEPIAIWPGLAPGETEKLAGTALPGRDQDKPPITRVENITHPTMQAFLPEGGGNGAAVVILPGGGFRYVVPDLEGSEAAEFLNRLGIAVFVLNYRTTADGSVPDRWRRPLQDSQRAIRFLRANAAMWQLDAEKIGLLAFSAGGQVGAIHIGEFGDAYDKLDAVDEQSARPDFAMLVYPWNVGDNATGVLMDAIELGKSAPPTFLVHTGDDASSALGSAAIYMALKKAGVPAELHVYQNGGHGYGTRPREGSAIGTWKDRAADWLRVRGIGEQAQAELPGLGRIVDQLQSRLDQLKRQRVMQDLATFKTALNIYRLNAGTFPTTEQGLAALVSKPTPPLPKSWERTLKKEVLDPWGNAYGYRYPPTKNDSAPDLFSNGPDGKAGTEDDIGNWTLEK